jgi:hypothetical protein
MVRLSEVNVLWLVYLNPKSDFFWETSAKEPLMKSSRTRLLSPDDEDV